jgi:transcription elongation factor GreA
MSQEGYDELVAELQHMVNVELPAVRDAIAEARDKGDLSENFEYHAAKREQGKLLSRISFKQKVLENARVIDKSRLKSDTVGLLSKIKITNLANKCSMNYTIVNPHEADKGVVACTSSAVDRPLRRDNSLLVVHPLDGRVSCGSPIKWHKLNNYFKQAPIPRCLAAQCAWPLPRA